MLIHDNHRRPTEVKVINSRLPVYQAYYGNGFGDVIQGLFTRIAPKVIPIAKQLGMKAIDVIRDKSVNVIGDAAGKAFSAVKDRLARLVRKPAVKPGVLPPVKLPSTENMPANISKIINQAANQKLAAMTPEIERNITSSLIAGSGITSDSRRLTHFRR